MIAAKNKAAYKTQRPTSVDLMAKATPTPKQNSSKAPKRNFLPYEVDCSLSIDDNLLK